MIELLTLPFMQRAFIAGLILALLLGYLGLFVALRRMAFFSDGLAHASMTGIAIGVITGIVPLYTAIIFSIFFAIAIFVMEKKSQLATDTVIGILFTSGLALGVTLMHLQGGYQPELSSFLFGNILSITALDLKIILSCAGIILSYFAFAHKKMFLLALNKEFAYLSGIRTDVQQLALYIFLSVSVVLGIKVVGVVLVSALLIIPVATAKLLSHSLNTLVLLTLLISISTVFAGIGTSYYANLPTGPTIVLVGAATFFVMFIASTFIRRV